MWYWFLLLIAVMALIVLFPWFVYVCFKVATVAVLRGRQFFDELYHKGENSNGYEKKE